MYIFHHGSDADTLSSHLPNLYDEAAMLKKARTRSAPNGSSFIVASTAFAAMLALVDAANRPSPDMGYGVLGTFCLTQVSTVVTTARTELLANGSNRALAASAADTKTSS